MNGFTCVIKLIPLSWITEKIAQSRLIVSKQKKFQALFWHVDSLHLLLTYSIFSFRNFISDVQTRFSTPILYVADTEFLWKYEYHFSIYFWKSFRRVNKTSFDKLIGWYLKLHNQHLEIRQNSFSLSFIIKLLLKLVTNSNYQNDQNLTDWNIISFYWR